jgi:hypothetical protein
VCALVLVFPPPFARLPPEALCVCSPRGRFFVFRPNLAPALPCFQTSCTKATTRHFALPATTTTTLSTRAWRAVE